MAVAKGQRQSDGTYIYTCGQCKGSGKWAGRTCSHCYNLDLPKLLIEFQLARGERYYAILKAILSLVGKSILDEAKRIKTENGKFRVMDTAYLTLKFGFGKRMKPLVEWLEECGFLPSGVYEDWKVRGLKVGDILARARLEFTDLGDYPEPPETEAQIDAYLRKHGYDPEQLAKDARDIFKDALENSPLNPKNQA